MRIILRRSTTISLTSTTRPRLQQTNKTLTAQGRETTNSVSGFADTTIPLPKNFSLFGGVRYTYDRKATTQ